MPKRRKAPPPKIAEELVQAVQDVMVGKGNGKVDLGNWQASPTEKVESVVRMLKQIDREVKSLSDQIDELQCQLEQRFNVEAKLGEILTRIVASEGQVQVGRIRVALIDKVKVKVLDLKALPDDLVDKETTTSIFPMVGKIRRRLLAGRKVPGAELRTVQRLRISGA